MKNFFKNLMPMLLLVAGLGISPNAWANVYHVVGVAANNSNNYDVYVNTDRQNWGWYNWKMTKAGITFEGKKLYITRHETDNGYLNCFQILLKSGDTQKDYKEFYKGSGSYGYYDNQILNYDDKKEYSKLTMYKPRVYFNANGWSQTSIKVVVGHANYQAYYSLSKITNTNLYFGYLTSMDWGDAMGFGVVGGTTASDGTNWLTDVSSNAKEYTGFLHYGLNQYKSDGADAMYYVTHTGKGEKPTCDFHSAYTDLNKTQTIKVMVKKAGASSYTETAFTNWPATIKAKRYKLNSNGASEANETDANLTSATFTSVITSAAKIYVPTPNTGYTFKGWGTSSSVTPSNASSDYEYTVADENTIYLFFDENTYSVTAEQGTGCASVNPTGEQTVGQLTGKQFTATGETGYYFVDWTSSNGGTFSDETNETTTFKPVGDATITANYAEKTFAVTATAGDGGSITTAPTSPAGQVTGTAISAEAAGGYIFSGWTITSGDGSFADAKSASTTYYPTSASTLLATFARATVTVNSGISSNHATLSGISDSHTITIGTDTNVPGDEDVTFTVSNLDNGYKIEGWYTNSGYTDGKHDEGQSTYILSSTNPNKNVYVKITPITYTITYNENGGTTQTDGTYTIESATITLPTDAQITKTDYTFMGWFDNSGLTGDAVTTIPTGSTGNKEYWAKWEETKHTVTLVNAKTGSSVQVGNVTDVTITANDPTPGYYFTGWTKEGNITINNASSATTTIKATGTGTVTANFAERWVLRGSKKGSADKGGMPANDAAGLMTTVTDGVASIVVTLEPNIDYQFKIFDKKSNSEKGQKNETILPPMTEDKSRWTLDGTNPVYLATVGHEQYTIYVAVDGENPKVYYSAPPSYQITMGTKTTSEGCAAATPGNGGNLTAEDGDHFPISDGKYVKNNGSVTFTATSNPGYSFAGFYSDAACTSTKLSDDNPYTISNITVNKIVYAKFTENLTPVTVFDGQTTTTIQAGVVSHPQIVAQDVDGQKFTGWSCEGVSVENTKAKTTNINSVTTTINTHKVTATYGELDAIYFDISNATQWTAYNPSDMWVFFYAGAYWSDQDGTGTTTGGSYKGDFVKMERVNSNDCSFWVAYYDADKIQSWGNVDHVAFADHVPTSAGPFLNGTTVSYFSFNHCMNTCVLSNNNGKNVNNSNRAYYRNEGFWKNYNAESSGLYLKMEGVTGDGGQEITTKVSADTYSISLHLNTGSAGASTYNYYFYISSCDGTNFTRNSGQITAENPKLNLCDRGTNIPGNKVTLHATATGSYTMLVTHKNDNTLDVTVEYPVSVGDFRVVSVIGGDAHDNGYLYKSSTTGTEMASFYVTNGATVKLQKCTAISGSNVTWTDVTGQSISNFTTSEYRNFKITHTSANATLADVGEYEGKFYLRTDVAPGGWSNYLTNAGNIMQENEYGMNDAQSFKFTHAYTNHVGHGGNVQFVIANDYSKCITDTLTTDDFIEDENGSLPSGKDANVRFMWNKNDNTVARAYIGGSANTQDRYLILFGNKKDSKSLMVDENGVAFPDGGDGRTGLHADEAIFKDLGNWVYQVNIKAFSGAAVKLMADFNGHTQYFVGAAEGGNAWRTIMAGDEMVNPYAMRAVYDFKSNRLVAGFIPDGNTITSNIILNGDLLIVRDGQGDAKEIKFGNATNSISKIDHIYCGLQINKSTMIGAKNSDYAKTMYWISFPFDVKISEIFGVGDYGRKWIIQKYNGKKRADIGWFKGDGTETFWEFMEYDETLNAYEGYLFMIDANYFDETSDDVWKIASVDNVTFYFPSANGNQGIIQQDTYEQPVNSYECKIDRPFANDPNKNHKVTDSYWSVIGVPVFQDAKAGVPETATFKSYYEWIPESNTYKTAVTLDGTQTFKTMHAYMVQFGGTLMWSNVSVVSNPAQAPYAYADAKNYRIELFFNGNGAEDHTYINLADGASTDFVLNEDMMKIDNAGFPNIYSFAGAYDVAYNETTFDNQSVMLGVSAPKDGSYTFAMPKDFSGKAVLVDLESGEATDLNLSNYTVELNKGTYNNRFQLLLEVEAKVPTNMNPTKGEWSEDGKTKKLFINDNIYLINAGRIYNASGTQVK